MSDGSTLQLSLPSISSAADSPAKTSHPPAGAPGSTAPAPASGASSTASSGSRNRNGSSSRTSRAASGDGSLASAWTSLYSATIRLPSRFLPSTLERPTDARACSYLLPTPTAQPYGTQNNGSPHDGREEYATKGKPSLETLAVRGLLPTPMVKGNYNHPGAGERSGNGLSTVAASDGPLSPRFVEWLMGFPDGWTDCDPLAMPLFPSAPRPSAG